MNKITLLFLILFNVFSLSGQVLEGQIGSGTNTVTDNLPISTNYAYNYSQQIYLASEIQEAIGNKNHITSIKFHVNVSNSSETYKDWKVFIGNTSKNEFEGKTQDDWISPLTLQEVFDGEVNFPNPTDDWFEIVFTTPFIWDGVSNIVIAVHEHTYLYENVPSTFRKMDTENFRGLFYRNDRLIPDPLMPPYPSNSTKYVPQVILVAEELMSCITPVGINISDVTASSAKCSFNIIGNNQPQGVEYYLSTDNTAPTSTTVGIEITNFSERELLLNNLPPSERYYIWFRTKCSDNTYTNWTNSYTFKTDEIGKIGEGDQTEDTFPISSDYSYNYSQQIYLASEVQTALGDNNRITSIKFHFKNSNSTENFKDWKIYLGNTSKNEFQGTNRTDWISPTDLQEVFNGEVSFPNPTDDWFEITFNIPFVWDGTSNLVIAVHENSPESGTSSLFRKMDTETNRGILYYNNYNDFNQVSPPFPISRVRHVPQVVLIGERLVGCITPTRIITSGITATTAKFNFDIFGGDDAEGVEYYLSTTDTAPTSTTDGIEISNFSSGELLLNNLTDAEQYYIWFRTKCSGDVYSGWTNSYAFKTLDKGLIGEGTETSKYLPISTNYEYNYSQQIYLSSEVQQVLGERNFIKSIKFHYNSSNPTDSFKDWKVFMGNTLKSEFDGWTQDDWVSPLTLQEVFDGEVSFPDPTDDWFEIVFDTPFIWDGTSNIVIAVQEYTGGFYAGGADFRKMNTSTNRGLYYRNDDNNFNPLSPATPNAMLRYVPQVVLVGEETPDCLYPINISVSDITTSSAKYRWNLADNSQATEVEYYLSTSNTNPSANTIPTGIINNTTSELLLANLNDYQEYYIWFRTKCGSDVYSEWSSFKTFKTLEIGKIGTGIETADMLPISTVYGYNYSQQIYLASELQLALGDKNRITAVKFYFNGPNSTNPFKDWKVFMGNTSKNEFEGSDNNTWVSPESLKEVFDGVVSFPEPTDDWFEIVFDTPFIWDGVSNIVIAVHEYTEGQIDYFNLRGNVTGEFRKMDTPTRRGINYRGSINFDPLSPVGPESILNYVPQVILVAESFLECLDPTTLTVSNVGANEATINWNGDSSKGHQYEVRTSGDAGSGVDGLIDSGDIAIGLSVKNIISLTPSTDYVLYLRTICNENSFSNWKTISFSTLQSEQNEEEQTLEGQIGEGVETSAVLPITIGRGINYSQQIYLASEIQSALGNKKRITSVKFHFDGPSSTNTFKDWRIFIGNTDKSEFEGATQGDWISLENLQQVFDGEVIFPDPTDDWFEIVFTTPFVWDGNSNIVIAVHEYATGNVFTDGFFRKMNTTTKRGLYKGVLFGNIDPSNPSVPDAAVEFVPQIILSGEEVVSCMYPIDIVASDLTATSIKYNWNYLGANVYSGVEYYLSENNVSPLGYTTEAIQIAGISPNELLLGDLDSDKQYYIWFRTQCGEGIYSEWTDAFSFSTLQKGQIGTGIETTDMLPISSNQDYNYSQQIYLASELQQAIGDETRITGIKFHINGPNTTTNFKDWKIFIGNTEKNAFEGLTVNDWISPTSFEEVFNGEVSFPNPTDDWFEITFNTPFIWDGASNLVIAVNEYSPDHGFPSTFRKIDNAINRGLYHTSVVSNPDLISLPAPTNRTNYVSQVVLLSEHDIPCIAPTALTVSNVGANEATLGWTGDSALSYEYEVRTSGAAGSGTVGLAKSGSVLGDVLSIEINELTPDTEYSVYIRLKCTNTVFSVWTSATKFNTNCIYPDFTVENASICGQGSITLQVNTESQKIKWFETESSSTILFEGTSFTTPLLTETRSYWVESYGGDMVPSTCVSPRKEVVVTVNPTPALELSTINLEICEKQSSELVTIVNGSDVYDTYSWSPSEGVQGDHLSGWIFNPLKTTEYVLNASQEEGGCETVIKLTVTVNLINLTSITPSEDEIIVCSGDIKQLEAKFEPEVIATIGDGTNYTADISDNSASNNSRNSSKSQMIYTANELLEAGYSAGLISSISFNINGEGASFDNGDYTVRVALTNLSEFPSNNFISEGFRTVYGSSRYTHNRSGWREIVFTTPFTWDGTSNIIIEISHLGTNDSNAKLYYTETTNNTLLFSYNDNSNITLSKNRYNIKFKRGYNYDVRWSPVANLYTDEAATIPYVEGDNRSKVFYKSSEQGNANVELSISSDNSCSFEKVYNIRTISITDAQAEENQSYCGVTQVLDLVAIGMDGAEFKWYRQETGGNALSGTSVVTSGEYYVSQKVGDCESTTRKKVTVTVGDKPVAPVAKDVDFCGNIGLSDLEITYDQLNVLRWYDSDNNPLQGDVSLQTGTYYVSQYNGNCESDKKQININVNPVPEAPIAIDQSFCREVKVSDLEVQSLPSALVNWYDTEISTVKLNPIMALRDGYYFVSQSLNGCESERIRIRVEIKDAVRTPIVQNQKFCNTTVTVEDLQAEGTEGSTINWYKEATGGTPLSATQSVTSGIYYVSQTINECESTRVRVGISIINNTIAPNVDDQIFCKAAKISDIKVTLASGISLKWYKEEDSTVALSRDSDLETGIYYVSQSINECESPRKQVNITVNELPSSPTGEAVQEFESGMLIGDIVMDQPNVIWFKSIADADKNRNRLDNNMPLVDGSTYYGVLESSEGCLSIPFAVTVNLNTLSINDFDISTLSYYPNPVKEVLTITYKDNIDRVEVYSLTGQRVLLINTSSNNVTVDMGQLQEATYLIKLFSEKASQTIKVVKK